MNCIRCGKCVKACPMGLVPSMLSILSQRGDYKACRDDYGLMNCVECGCCTYVCPAKRNIVQYIRLAKNEIRAEAAREKAKDEAKKEKEAAK
jgi:electron transport complex protein RnfC